MPPLTFGWLQGSLVSASALHEELVECALGPHEEAIARTVRRCRLVHRRAGLRLGPASGATAVWRLLAAPIAELLDWQIARVGVQRIGSVTTQVAHVGGVTGRTALVVALPWGMAPGPAARPACRLALDAGVRWTMLTNGLAWRWLDTHRPLGRQHVELQLHGAVADERVWEALWLMGQADVDRLERLARLTIALEASATRAVRHAVADVRTRLAHHLAAGDDEVLTHVFRWLFLLFAEARHLLPMHNPVYRQAYAISTMAGHAQRGQPPFGLWDGLRASAQLAHAGSRHPLLQVTALNGALFEPERTPRSSHRRLPDGVVAPMLEALTTVTHRDRRLPVSFADLGVEHLGTIYEDVLAGRRSGGGSTSTSAGLVRKLTGTFYTPRDLADHLVAETLSPLVAGQSVEQILALRIVDPAAGSGAVLASAARFLLSAVEAAWLRDGRGGALDVPARERADVVRRMVEQCLYGVDIHGRAVQVARLSLWLVSMTRERPLTFLDHHLRVGNSLIGATPAQVVTRRPGRLRRAPSRGVQPALFDLDEWDRRAGDIAMAFDTMAASDSDSADAVRAKTRLFRTLHDNATLRRWRRRADLWCGAWMLEAGLSDGVWSEVDGMTQGRATSADVGRLAAVTAALERHARDAQCFHWAIEFPEIFHARRPAGFDAVLANPPWEMLRADLGSAGDRASTRADVARQQRFVVRSGLYSAGTTGHRNLYQLFVERMLQLCRDGGRIGVIAPWGLMADHASAATRRTLLRAAAIDRVTVFENRRGIFPIHRSVRFVSLTATTGSTTTGLTVRPAVDTLDADPRRDARRASDIWLETGLLEAADRRGLAVPCIRSGADLHALRALLTHGRRLEEPPWNLAFGRELNASDDRALLRGGRPTAHALAVVGGRDLRPFAVAAAPATTVISMDDAARRLPFGTWRRWRLGYRDVAAATNRLSLIAAMVPPHVLTTHTVFVLRQSLRLRDQLYLCGVLNSLVANWFVRLYMGTHVTAALVGRLPVPRPAATPRLAGRVARLAARLRHAPAAALDMSADYIELQAAVAAMYGLSVEQFAAMVATFPGLRQSARDRMVESLAAGGTTGALSVR
jgi:hypothetical protein